MTEWLKSTFSGANFLTVVLVISGLVAGWARAEYRDAHHDAVLADHEQRLRVHVNDRDIHTDPRWNEERWEQVMRRLQRIEDKLDEQRR